MRQQGKTYRIFPGNKPYGLIARMYTKLALIILHCINIIVLLQRKRLPKAADIPVGRAFTGNAFTDKTVTDKG